MSVASVVPYPDAITATTCPAEPTPAKRVTSGADAVVGGDVAGGDTDVGGAVPGAGTVLGGGAEVVVVVVAGMVRTVA